MQGVLGVKMSFPINQGDVQPLARKVQVGLACSMHPLLPHHSKSSPGLVKLVGLGQIGPQLEAPQVACRHLGHLAARYHNMLSSNIIVSAR